MRPRTDRNVGLVASIVGIACLSAALSVPSSLRAHEEDSERALDPSTKEVSAPAEIWEAFVKHLEASGHGDLVAPYGDSPPDFSRGDPIRGALFRVSNDLVNLDALFLEEETSRLEPAERRERIEEHLEKLAESEDPYLEAYGRYYGARFALEEDRPVDAVALLEKLTESPRFLARGEARKSLAEAYRRIGEDTLALLEVQFYLTSLEPEETSARLWADEQLEEIRERHEGPLHDCSARSRKISTLLTSVEVGKETQGEQRKVEDILEKVAKLLEEKAGRCPLCNSPLAQQCKQCQKEGKMCKSCQGKKPCQACGQGQGQGQGKLAQGGNGDPRGNKPTDSPARDTKLEKGDRGEARLRDDVGPGSDDAWGEINDRDVARSLREAWSKIPPSYRTVVVRYFRDITDLEPEEDREDR